MIDKRTYDIGEFKKLFVERAPQDLAIACIVYLFIPFLCLEPITEGFIPFPIAFFLVLLTILAPVIAFISPVAIIFGIFMLLFNRMDFKNATQLITLTVFFLASIVLLPVSTCLKQHLHQKAMSRLDRISRAIDQYTRDNGNTPKSLTDLIPEYIDAIPTTGMNAFPRFTYLSLNQNGVKNRYLLAVDPIADISCKALVLCPFYQINEVHPSNRLSTR